MAVCGGLGLFMAEADPDRVVCITGTKGKSTTTALAVHLLNGLGSRARAGGNIGHPPWDPSSEPAARLLDRRDLELPGSRPGLAPRGRGRHLLGAGSSRLARHGRAVLRRQALAVHQTRRDAGPGRRHGRRAPRPGRAPRARTSAGSPRQRWQRTPRGRASLGLTGPHNARNASLARAVLEGLGIPGASDADRLAEAAPGFRRTAQPLPFPGLSGGGRVRRRQPLDQRAARPGRAGGLCGPARRPARRRARPGPRLRAARPGHRPARQRRPSS